MADESDSSFTLRHFAKANSLTAVLIAQEERVQRLSNRSRILKDALGSLEPHISEMERRAQILGSLLDEPGSSKADASYSKQERGRRLMLSTAKSLQRHHRQLLELFAAEKEALEKSEKALLEEKATMTRTQLQLVGALVNRSTQR